MGKQLFKAWASGLCMERQTLVFPSRLRSGTEKVEPEDEEARVTEIPRGPCNQITGQTIPSGISGTP